MNKNIKKILEDYILGKYNIEICANLAIAEINKEAYKETFNNGFRKGYKNYRYRRTLY